MKAIHIDFESIPQFSSRDIAYQNNPEAFKDFLFETPTLQNFKFKIEDRLKYPVDRALLCNVLNEQYNTLSLTEKQNENLERLKDSNCFTVCTAHQLSLLTGPLYYPVKILSAIVLTEQLQEAYPNYTFIPFFVHGSEDHDFEEIAHCSIFNKDIEWQNEEPGAVGRMSLDKFEEVLAELKGILGSKPKAIEWYSLIESIFNQSNSYSEFCFRFVHELFKNYGLLQLNMDNEQTKMAFKEIFQKEIKEQFSFHLVNQQISTLENLGYKAQATPRECNLFRITNERRERIAKVDDHHFELTQTNKVLEKGELLALIDKVPHEFSPNVILRPLYQELILPNLAYVGGGGELAYWIERKLQFKEANISFPLLIRRDSIGIIAQRKLDQWHAMGLELSQLFADIDLSLNSFAKSNFSIPKEIEETKIAVMDQYKKLESGLSKLDKGLGKSALTELQKTLKGIENLEGKAIRNLKAKNESSINRIRKIASIVQPSNGLQERKTNFLQFALDPETDFLDAIKTHINPLDKKFKLIVYPD